MVGEEGGEFFGGGVFPLRIRWGKSAYLMKNYHT